MVEKEFGEKYFGEKEERTVLVVLTGTMLRWEE